MLKKIILMVTVGMVFSAMLIRPFIIKPVYTSNEVIITKEKQPIITIEKPQHNIALPIFSSIKSVKQKKQAFFSFLRPIVEAQNTIIIQERQQVKALIEQYIAHHKLNDQQLTTVNWLTKKYRITYSDLLIEQALKELLNRVDIIPTPLVLVQAANESAWGTSRFARIGLNFFGIWCYQKGCGMVPRARKKDSNHEVEAFQSVDSAVQHYLHNINTNNAYQVFRTIRMQLRKQELPLSSQVLATGLMAYSERGEDYITEIMDMLRHNRHYLEIKKKFPKAPAKTTAL